MREDHIDRLLARLDPDALGVDLEVEGIVDRILSIAKRIRRELEATLAEHDVNHGEWHVLISLYHAGEPYRRSPGDLAAALELSSGAMTNRLDRLEERGLLRRRPEPKDRRGVQVELTKKGLAILLASTNTQARKESLIAAVLSEREKKQLNALLRKLMLSFDARD